MLLPAFLMTLHRNVCKLCIYGEMGVVLTECLPKASPDGAASDETGWEER